jgi:pyruvate dehydrogenase E2 component (dihydrolipoyllysine-residue acetyltransferase)
VPRPIVMPSFGMYTVEGVLTVWLQPSGASVQAGEPVLEIETEKSTVEVAAPESGLLHHVARPGDRLQVESLIGYVLSPGESAPESTSDVSVKVAAVAPMSTSIADSPIEIQASPIAKRLAKENGIDLSQVKGSGPGGRIVEADIISRVQAQARSKA